MSTNTISMAIIGFLALGGLLAGPTPSAQDPAQATPPSPAVSEAVTPGSETVLEVRSAQAWVRETPGGTEKVAVLPEGTRVTQVGRAGDWIQVRLADGREGWLSGLMVGAPSLAGSGRSQVWAYYVQDRGLSSWSSFAANADRLAGVMPWAFSLDGNGNLRLADQLSAAELAQVLQRAGRSGLETHLLVQNFRAGSFDRAAVHQLLNDSEARRRAAGAMVEQAKAWGAAGIHLDLENVPPSDRPVLTTFVQELSARLRAEGLEFSMALPAKTEDRPSHSWSGAFDYRALAPHLDWAVLMTYDQHSRTGSPGPIAAAPWVEAVVQHAVAAGFSPDRLLLGVAGYGYDWPREGTARTLTHGQVVSLFEEQRRLTPELTLRWDASAKSPYFRYGSGHEVWFENHESLAYKLQIAERYGLAGVALWRLGQEDPESWSLLAGS